MLQGCYDEIRAAIESNSVIFLSVGGVTLFLEVSVHRHCRLVGSVSLK